MKINIGAFNFFKKDKKTILIDLERAEKEGIISKEEFLELKLKRAKKELDDYLESQKSKKK